MTQLGWHRSAPVVRICLLFVLPAWTAIAAGDIGTGTNFGLRDSAYYGGGIVQFSNFSMTNAVPEPASLGLLVLGAAGLMHRRRSL